MKKHLIFILLLSAALDCHAKQGRFYGKGELSCNLITDMCQDGNGFVWIGTANGLNKFDGWTFTHYFQRANDSTSLSNNYVQTLFVDDDQQMWVGTNKGLQCYLPYEDSYLSAYFLNNSRPSVEGIAEAPNGEIWITTSGQGVFSIDKQTMKATKLEYINKLCGTLFFNRIYKDRSQTLWIPFGINQVLRITPGMKEGKDFQLLSLPHGLISDFIEDNEGRLFATSSCLSQWDPEKDTFVPLKDIPIRFGGTCKLQCNKQGLIYIGTNGEGVKLFDPKTMKVYPANNINSPGINPDKIKVASLMEDREGNIWVGCFRKGVLMISNDPALFDFWDFTAMEYQTGGCISAIYKDREGCVWSGTETGEIMKLDKNGQAAASYALERGIASMFEDTEGTFWVGTRYRGILQFDRRSGQYRTLPILTNEYIKGIVEGKDKNLYLAAFGNGLAQYNPVTNKLSLITDKSAFQTPQRLENNWINYVLNDSKGYIWVGHYKGVNCYDPKEDIFRPLNGDSVLRTTICYSLLEDKQGTVWMGTNNGLFGYNGKNGQLKHYSTLDGLPDNVICGLAEDGSGNIWCSTYRGLCLIRLPEEKVYPYLSGNGLYDWEYTRGVYFQDERKEAYFGGVYGIIRFQPDSIRIPDIKRSPILTHIYLNNKPVSARACSGGVSISRTVFMDASKLHLSHHDNTFSMEFSMMDYRDPENISYEYRLAGINNDWTLTPPGSNRITYNRLPPGRYTIEIRASENGVYSPVKNLSVVISPPWYTSFIAKIVYGLLMLGFIGTIFLYQQRRLKRIRQEEINEEKLKFFINISHEIRSPMTLIISPLSMLMKREYDETTKRALHSMYRSANRIVTLLNQLLDIRKIDKGLMKITFCETDLVSFINELLQAFEYQTNKQNIYLLFEHDMESLDVWIDQNNFDKVLINLLGNALKFTPNGGEITIRLTTGIDKTIHTPLAHFTEISIIDSGVGLDESKLEKIFERFYQDTSTFSSGSGIGLHLCKTLIELHHGIIVAANRKNTSGSCFTIRLPMGSAHLKTEEIAEQRFTPRLVLKQSVDYSDENLAETKYAKRKTHYKVLIIDDNDEILHYLRQELSPIYRTMTCNNGVKGLQMALDIQPDLIVSDVVMPEMDGFTFLRKIKSNGNTGHIPVILLTSQTEYDNRIKGWDKGADAILTKPFNIEELLLLCSNLISSRVWLRGKFKGIQDQEERIKPIEIKSNDEQLMERLMVVINKNMDNSKFNVEILAEEVGISRVQLHRKLKEIAGIPTSEFIRNIRLKHAAELLKARKINVSQVAYAVGYSNPVLFSIVFKKFYGCSPTEYSKE